MEIVDQRSIAAPPEAVWRALTDPEVLRRCIPGCQEMVGSVEDGFEAVVVQKVGPVKATFRGRVTLEDVRPGAFCRIVGEGKGGAAGFARGSADVTLDAAEGGTRLAYKVDAKVGGKLAQLGARVIDGVARRMAEQFFASFQAEVEGPGAAPGEAVAGAPAAAGGEAPAGAGAAGAAAPEGGAKPGWLDRFRRG